MIVIAFAAPSATGTIACASRGVNWVNRVDRETSAPIVSTVPSAAVRPLFRRENKALFADCLYSCVYIQS